MTGTEVHSISSHSVCKIPVIAAAHTPSWAYCTCQITSVHLSSVFLCSLSLSFSQLLSYKNIWIQFSSLELKKPITFTVFLYILLYKTRSRLLKYLQCTPCLLCPVHTLFDTSRAFSKLNNAVWCDMIIALFQQPAWRLARASRRKMLIIKSSQQQDRTPWKQQLLYKTLSWNCSLSHFVQCTELRNGCSKGPF